MRSVSWAAFAAAGILGIDNAHAQRFNVPPGRLGEVAAALGEQGGATITVTDPDLAARRSPGVKGSFRLRAALDRALRGTGTEAMFYKCIGGHDFFVWKNGLYNFAKRIFD